MKILFMVHSLTGGGAERVAANVMSALSERHTVHVLLFEPRVPGRDYELSPNVQVTVLDRPGKGAARQTGYVQAIRQIKAREKYDVCISFLEFANAYNVLSRQNEKVIVSIRNLTSAKNRIKKNFWIYKLYKPLDWFADRVVCVSEDVAQDQHRHYHIRKKRLRVIHNWVDAEGIAEKAAQPLSDEAFSAFAGRFDFLLCASGRFDVQKGFWHLIRAFHRLHEAHPEAGLFILGDGELREKLTAEIGKHGLSDCVYLCGRQKNPFAYMARADAFVLSSLYEGFSNALLEAMACNLPVLSADCAGVRELLTPERPLGQKVKKLTMGEYGLVSPPLGADWPEDAGSPMNAAEEGLREGMEALLAQPQLRTRYVEAGKARLNGFTRARILPQWETVAEEMLKSSMDPSV